MLPMTNTYIFVHRNKFRNYIRPTTYDNYKGMLHNSLHNDGDGCWLQCSPGSQYTKSAKQKVFAEEAGCPQSAVSKHIMLAAVGALKNTTDRNIHNMGDVVFSAAGPEETSAKHLFPLWQKGKRCLTVIEWLKIIVLD